MAIAAFLWGAFAATALALDAGGWDEVARRPARRPDSRLRWGPALDGAGRRGAPQGRRARAAVPDRARRGRRHDGRLRVRRALRPRVRRRRGRRVLHGRRSAAPRRACWRASTSGCSRAGSTVTCCTRASWAWRSARRDRARAEPPLRERLAVAAGIVVARACSGHVLWNAPVLALSPTAARARARSGSSCRSTWRSRGCRCCCSWWSRSGSRAPRAALARRGAGLRGRSARASRPRSSTCSASPHAGAPRCRDAAARGRAARRGLLARLQREQVDLAMVASRVDHARRPGASWRSATTARRCGTPSRRSRAPRPPPRARRR